MDEKTHEQENRDQQSIENPVNGILLNKDIEVSTEPHPNNAVIQKNEDCLEAVNIENSYFINLMKTITFEWATEIYMRKRYNEFKWSDKVEALCSPDVKEKGLLDDRESSPVIPTKTAKIMANH